ncbi:pyruvate kinase [Pseudoloma neurophilia]|uniref:Pyruvate kinase n=1 Tax=Pseudoloma neurophilia TaxID=146866 RepID=A0A0R0M8I0_9MICR|nr:pyruvate kinase [Pseudoloma neurophilia]
MPFTKTKIICTIGPASENKLQDLVDMGMKVARLNFSHGDHQSHGKIIDKLKIIRQKSENSVPAIAIDTKGPEMRLKIKKDRLVIENEIVTLSNGTHPADFQIELKNMNQIKPGHKILFDDGKIQFTVKKSEDNLLIMKSKNRHLVKNNKAVNIPGIKMDESTPTSKDIEDIIFGLKKNVDVFFLSFVNTAEDVINCKRLVEDINKTSDDVIRLIQKNNTSDAHIERLIQKNNTHDAHIERLVQKNNTSDAHIERLVQNKNNTSDAHIERLVQKNNTSDAHIERLVQKNNTSDAHIERLIQKNNTSDDIIKKPMPLFFSKIESLLGIKNLEEIIKVSDGIMVARGDLSVEIGYERLFEAQKLIIDMCHKYNKPIIMATQMLESMCENSYPYRSEISDIGNAVLDGCDCTMLSGESASGKFPIKAVKTMRNVILSAERYQKKMSDSKILIKEISSLKLTKETGNNETGNNEKGNNEKGNNETRNNETRNNETRNNETGNNETGNNETRNNETVNNEKGNNETGNEKGNESAKDTKNEPTNESAKDTENKSTLKNDSKNQRRESGRSYKETKPYYKNLPEKILKNYKNIDFLNAEPEITSSKNNIIIKVIKNIKSYKNTRKIYPNSLIYVISTDETICNQINLFSNAIAYKTNEKDVFELIDRLSDEILKNLKE